MKCAYKNLLETSTVSLAAGTAHADYPLYRTYDRHVGRIFKTTAAVTTEVMIDQGASGNLAADRLLIPSGHNLDGMTLDILYSDNGADWSAAVTQWVQSGSGLINKSWASLTKRYWKFKITSPASAPEIAEIFLTQTYTWETNPRRPKGPFEDLFNVERLVTAGGQTRYLVHGDARRQRAYALDMCGTAQKDNIAALWAAWAGSNPFWLEDEDAAWIYGELLSPLNLTETHHQRYAFEFNFLEALG